MRSRVNQAMLETIVRRNLCQLQRDPKRCLRKLVDLGREAADGPVQAMFFKTAQEMLQREDSPYYTLAQNTACLVDHDRLLAFGMALGWTSLTCGVSRIRSQEKRLGCAIPWSLTLHLEQRPDSLSAEDYLSLIREGTQLGISSYVLFPKDAGSVALAVKLAQESRACAFCLLLPRGFGPPDRLAGLPLPPNLMLGIDACEPGWRERAELLRRRRALYLLYRTYSGRSDEEELVSGRWAEGIVPYAGSITLLISRAGGPCPPDGRVSDYAVSSRMEQRYPTLMVDFYHDSLCVSRCISQQPCFVGILPDGTATEYRQGEEVPAPVSLRAAPLAQLLQRLSRRGAQC